MSIILLCECKAEISNFKFIFPNKFLYMTSFKEKIFKKNLSQFLESKS